MKHLRAMPRVRPRRREGMSCVVLFASFVAGCASTPSPRVSAHGEDGALDELAFIEGCWQYYSVDAGAALCWRRHDRAWDGAFETLGPMAVRRTIHLSISLSQGQLQLSNHEARRVLPLTTRGESFVAFGDGDHRWELLRVDDRLMVASPGSTHRYEMDRAPTSRRPPSPQAHAPPPAASSSSSL
ncbi:MAG: hypothetical protein H6726_25760 [Sandaracinaceae bacterium]|nr:hypothetical protein [Sandaracinaceae bacterium]